MALEQRHVILGGLVGILSTITGCSTLNPSSSSFLRTTPPQHVVEARDKALLNRLSEQYPKPQNYPLEFPVYGPSNLEHCTWMPTPEGNDISVDVAKGYRRSGRWVGLILGGGNPVTLFIHKPLDDRPLSISNDLIGKMPSSFSKSLYEIDLKRCLDDTVLAYVKSGDLAVVPKIMPKDVLNTTSLSDVKQYCEDRARTKAYRMCDKPIVQITWEMDSPGSRKTMSAFCQAARELKQFAVFCLPGYGDRFNNTVGTVFKTEMSGDFHPTISIYDPRIGKNDEKMKTLGVLCPASFNLQSTEDVETLYLMIKDQVLKSAGQNSYQQKQ